MLLCELFLCELLLCKLLQLCDEDTLVYQVSQTTAACHTGHRSCFYRTLDGTITSERLFDPEQVYGKK